MTEEETRKAQGKRLAAARKAAGHRSAREAAKRSGWPESTYRAHENGSRTIGQDDAEKYARRFRGAGVKSSARDILFGADRGDEHFAADRPVVPIMGYVGAGAEILPEFEQVPPEGLGQVELPFAVPPEMVGLEVKGDSMLPRYEDGDVIIVWLDQHSAIDALLGEEAAVRTERGQRYLKRLLRGAQRGTFNLESTNASAKTIEGVRIDWASEVYLTVRAAQVRRIAKRERAGLRSQVRRHAAANDQELPLRPKTKST